MVYQLHPRIRQRDAHASSGGLFGETLIVYIRGDVLHLGKGAELVITGRVIDAISMWLIDFYERPINNIRYY